MVYLFGVLGFAGGFMAGLLVINYFLKDVSRTELLQKKSQRWQYGLAVWMLAAIGAYVGVWMHTQYFAVSP